MYLYGINYETILPEKKLNKTGCLNFHNNKLPLIFIDVRIKMANQTHERFAIEDLPFYLLADPTDSKPANKPQ